MNLLFELKYAFRTLRKHLGHTILSTTVIALSLSIALIGSTIFYNILLRPIDFPNADRWAHLVNIYGPDGAVAAPDNIDIFRYQYFQEHNTAFEKLGALKAFNNTRISNGRTTTRIFTAMVTPHLVEDSGLQVYLGRSLQATDSYDETAVVISYSLWQNFFNGDPDIIGRTVQMDETPKIVVGVMSRGKFFGMNNDAWMAKTWFASSPDRNREGLTPVGILQSGVTYEIAQRELSNLSKQLQKEYPGSYGQGLDVRIFPFRLLATEGSIEILDALMLAVVVIVVLGCINITNLFMFRNMERQQEFALRSCVGSSVLQLVRRSLTESLLVCVIGLVATLPIAWLGMQGVNSYLLKIADAEEWKMFPDWLLSFDTSTIVIIAMALGLLWLAAGLLPALEMSKKKLGNGLINSNKGSVAQQSFKATNLLVAAQIIACCFLLIISGSLLLSVVRIVNVDYGVATKNRYVVDIEMPNDLVNTDRSLLALRSIQNELTKVSNIEDVSIVSGLPHTTQFARYSIADRDIKTNGQFPFSYVSAYSENTFSLLDVAVIEGRSFDATDIANSSPVIIIDQVLANNIWPGESPLGKQVQLRPESNGGWYTIIGVSKRIIQSMQMGGFNNDPTIYLPISQVPTNKFQLVVSTRTEIPLNALGAIVGDAVSRNDSRIAIYNPRTMTQHLMMHSYGFQLIANIFIGLGLAAVGFAVIGLFAMVSRTVSQQTKIIGIRRAMGSSRAKVLLIYLKQGFSYLSMAILVGGGAAMVVIGYLSAIFTEITDIAPLVAMVTLTALAILIAIASLIPAGKILKIEPGEALHYE